MIIEEDEIRYIAKLARIDFDSGEICGITKDLEEIISFFNKLNEVETVNADDESYDKSISDGSREDLVKEPLPRTETIRNAPVHNGTCFVVPSVIE